MRYEQLYKPLQLALCASLMCASFSSCSNSETDSPTEADGVKVPLSISAVIQSGTEARKADYDATAFETGDEIGLFILSSDDYTSAYSSDYSCYNVRATYNGTSWTLDEDVYLYEENAYILAYYPYSDSYGTNFPDGGNLSDLIPIDIMPSDNTQTDVLTCGGVSVNYDSPTAELDFNHVLSRIVLSISLTGEIETVSLTSVSLSQSGGQLQSAALLGIDGGSFNNYSSDSYATIEAMTMTCDTTLTLTDRYSVDFLVSPESSASLTATLVIDGISFDVDITSPSDWVSAYQYTYLINVIGEQDILLEGSYTPVIYTWVSSGIDGIEFTYQDINGRKAVDLGLSVKWATCNVGATSPEEYGNYYAWGEIKTKVKYTNENNITHGIEMDDISGNAEYDAATVKWGNPWRMPTYDEMAELVDSCTWTWTTLNDVEGNLVTGKNGNSIFLPFAGYMSESGVDVGYQGYYWSSTPVAGDNRTDCAYNLVIGNGTYYMESYLWRDNGDTIRPVTE